MTKEHKKSWTCQACRNKRPKGDNSNTPVRSLKSDTGAEVSCSDEDSISPNFVTARRPTHTKVLEVKVPPSGPQSIVSPTDQVGGSLKDQLLDSLRLEIPSLLSQVLKKELVTFKEELLELRKSVSFLSDMNDEMRENIKSLSKDNKQLKSENDALKSSVHELSDRLNKIEQSLRDKNLEIKGVPEHPSENVLNLIQQCASIVGHKIADGDVVKCNRVAKQNKNTNVPRTIIVQFNSERRRDEFYSAVYRYNKANPDNKLNTALFGLAGEKKPVYISEHLSPQNQALHIAARMRAKELSYKFVWVRSGRIFVRKDPGSQYIFIKDSKSLDLMH
ncbi:uncharacterized protein LOC123701524 [Colias croceus]|uniref:uncharacterized protein LOC123691938 n=1 Tax=Colias crocea TaxID=72248 RepID=UPI001E27BB99|nr:uncharacterized protein LOC123691938 [Colias croceus]XP_045504985.1 uncharacterized protein LOC123701524 [Colias croceus]